MAMLITAGYPKCLSKNKLNKFDNELEKAQNRRRLFMVDGTIRSFL